MNKTLVSLLVAAALAATTGCGSDGSDRSIGSTGPGIDPVTGLAADDPANGDPAIDVSTDASTDSNSDASARATTDANGGATARDGTSGEDADLPLDNSATDTARVALLSLDNYEDVVRRVFSVYAGNGYGADLLALPPYPELVDLPLEGSPYEGSVARQDVCGNGGTADLSVDWSGARVVSYDRRGVFDDCQVDDATIDGEIELLATDNYGVSSSGLEVRRGDEVRSFSGGIGYGDGNNYGGGNQRWWTTSELDWSILDGDAVRFAIEDANTAFETYGPFEHALRGGFTLTDDVTGGRPLVVEIPDELTHPRRIHEGEGFEFDAWTFTTGTLRLTAGDGSRVTIEADNGDEGSARVTVDDGAEVQSFDKPWSDWDAVLKAGPSPTP